MHSQVKLVVLVGPMGAGKTTIGKILAKELGYSFFDSDREIERRCGANIPWIFDVEGELGFRQREMNIIDELSQSKNTVLATGGGAMLREENRAAVSSRGLVVYLNTSVEQQFRRTHKDKNRPLLQNGSAKQTLTALYAERDPIYRDVADIIVSTDGKPVKSVVKSILAQIN